jgi:cell division protease FtsH
VGSKYLKRGIIYLVVIAALVAIFFTFLPSSPAPDEWSLSKVVDEAEKGMVVEDGVVSNTKIESVEHSGEKLTLTLTNGEDAVAYIPEGMTSTEVFEMFSGYGVEYEYIPQSGFDWGSLLFTLLPLVIFIGLIWYIFSRARGAGNQAMNFGRSKARLFPSTKPAVTFDDVAGVDEAKTELEEVVEFLKSPEKFSALGARIPKGVLLVGPPGSGKTLMARAVAGEAAVPFFSISGSEFVEMFVGVGASRVRDLFDQAKRNNPCIVFIDEIDAVGRHRGAGFGGGHDEREQTLNQILVEMDGFDTSTNVIVLAATNRPDILDPALLRPGRFDRQVVLDRPDIKGRKGILEVHAKGMPLEEGVELGTVAKQTPGFSGADLANLVNEAAILAARRNKKKIGLDELEESIDRVIAGPERKSRIISDKEKEITAYHEAGHALAARMLPNADPVHKVSIIARGMMGGYTRLLPKEDRYLWTRSQFYDALATTLGGHCAEEIIFGETSTGPESDIEQGTKIARKMVTEYGMSERLGPRTFGRREELVFLGREVSEQKDYSEQTAQEIDEEVHRIIQQAYGVAKDILTTNRAKLVQIAQELVAKETIEGEELEELFNRPVDGEPPLKEETAEAAPEGVSEN